MNLIAFSSELETGAQIIKNYKVQVCAKEESSEKPEVPVEKLSRGKCKRRRADVKGIEQTF